MTDARCPACEPDWPDPRLRIADLGLTVASLHDDQFFPGATVLALKSHATELFELSVEQRARMIEEVTLTARVLAAEFDARKINYALLGNQIPHVHWHVVPRRADDPAPRDAVWAVPHSPRRLDDAERAAIIARLRRRFATLARESGTG